MESIKKIYQDDLAAINEVRINAQHLLNQINVLSPLDKNPQYIDIKHYELKIIRQLNKLKEIENLLRIKFQFVTWNTQTGNDIKKNLKSKKIFIALMKQPLKLFNGINDYLHLKNKLTNELLTTREICYYVIGRLNIIIDKEQIIMTPLTFSNLRTRQ